MNRLIVGDVGVSTFQKSLEYDDNPILITDNNFNKYITNLGDSTFFTSLGDLKIDNFIWLLENIDYVIYHKPIKWSNEEMWIYTEQLLSTIATRKPVENFTNINNDYRQVLNSSEFNIKRKSSSEQIWFIGDSITAGSGVNNDEIYYHSLADKINLPHSVIATPGSSLVYQASSILMSDIKSNDVVIWGLTSSARIPYYNGEKIYHVLPNWWTDPSLAKLPIKELDHVIPFEYFLSKNIMYNSLVSIFQIINFCKKLDVKLLLGGFLTDYDTHLYLNHLNNYIQFYNEYSSMFYDVGTDNLHPGPKTHQLFANELYKLYTKLYI